MSRLRGRLRVALRIARRDAVRHRGRTVLVVLLLTLPVAAGSALLTLVPSLTAADATLARSLLGPDLSARITVASAGPVGQDARGELLGTAVSVTTVEPDGGPAVVATADERDLLERLPAGTELVAADRVGVAFTHGRRVLDSAGVERTELDRAPVAAAHPVRAGGRLPTADGEVALGLAQARALDAGVGDRVDADGDTWTVVGVLADRVGSTAVVAAPTALPEGASVERQWLALGDPVTWDAVRALNQVGAVVVSRAVLADPPGPDELDPAFASASDVRLAQTVAVACGLVALEAVLLIGPAFAVGARRSVRELALLAATGADRRTLAATVLAGGLVAGTTAAALGTALGVGFVALVRLVSLEVPNLVVPVPRLLGLACFAVACALVAAWLPSRTAARQDTVAALAGRYAPPRVRAGHVVAWGVVAGAGAVTAVGGARAGLVPLLGLGSAALVLGLLPLTGTIVAGLAGAPAAGRLPFAPRFALRDAARHRSRTSPAVAAVLVAVAVASALLVYTQSGSRYDREIYRPVASAGTVVVQPPYGTPTGLDADVAGAAAGVLAERLPDAAVHPLRVLAADGDRPVTVTADTAHEDLLPPGPSWTGVAHIGGPLVDDGTAVRDLAVPEPERAAAALAAGRVVVRPDQLTDRGTTVLRVAPAEGDPEDDRVVEVPATAVGDASTMPANLPLVPPVVADDLGLEPATVGFLAVRGDGAPALDALDLRDLGDALAADDRQATGVLQPWAVVLEDGPPSSATWVLLVVLGIGLLVALAATGMTAALTATETRPDLATLAAVGAPPAVAARAAAAQSGVVAAVGAVLGVAAGLVIGAGFVLARRWEGGPVDTRWVADVPWVQVAVLLVALPAVAGLAAGAVARVRVVLTRRAA